RVGADRRPAPPGGPGPARGPAGNDARRTDDPGRGRGRLGGPSGSERRASPRGGAMIETNGDGRIAIIGGGLGGLAAARTLAARGYETVLFEKNPGLGGKAAVLERGGFRFDMGPTILTLPSVLARIFAEAGRTLRQELDLIPLDPQWRCFYPDGSVLDL